MNTLCIVTRCKLHGSRTSNAPYLCEKHSEMQRLIMALVVRAEVGKRHPIYLIWTSMKSRCTNHKAAGYKNYGGRGIQVCDAWQHFINFFIDMWPTWQKGLTLDRKDNDGNYCKDNCQWVTWSAQANNKRPYEEIYNETWRKAVKDGRLKAQQAKQFDADRFVDELINLY